MAGRGLAEHLTLGAGMAAGVLTDRACGSFFAVRGHNGIHASPLGCVVLSAGPLSVDDLLGMYDDERDRYARRVLSEFDADGKAQIIHFSVCLGWRPQNIARVLDGDLDFYLETE